MVTSVEQATEDFAARVAAPMAQANTYAHVQTPRPAPATNSQPPAGGMDPMDFVRANRIQVKDGSLFIDPYLAIHPRELDPANEAQLREKLALTYSINNPSFFDNSKRMAIAVNLGQLVPVSAAAKRSQLLDEVARFNAQADTGNDAELQKEFDRKMAPFSSIVRSVSEQPQRDPVGAEVLQNGLAIYLLMRERLTQAKFLNPVADYITRVNTPEQIMADLSNKIGITPMGLRDAALKGGVDGVGKLLGLDPAYVADVKALAAHVSTQDFSYNLIEHWHLGRQLAGAQAPLEQKLSTGMEARITGKIAEFRSRVHNTFDVPESIKKEEARIAESLNLVEPVQRTLMYKLGYELCYTPEVNADSIAFYPGIYGLHRKAANNLSDVRGTYRIFFSGHGDAKASARTMVHEVAHNLWPSQFSPEEAKVIDGLAQSDARRFAIFQTMLDTHYPTFERLFNAYKAANEQEKPAVISATNQLFAAYGLHAEGLFPYLRDARDFQFAVKHVNDTLSIEGDRYNRSGYNTPEERFREVLSRFAELKQVEYRGEPQFLQFLAPGLNQIWEAHYIPHLERVSHAIDTGASLASPVAKAHDAEPKVREEVKVREQPTQDAAPFDGVPSTLVDAPSIQLNSRTLPALANLQGQGFSPQF